MRIGVDVSCLVRHARTGVETYTHELVQAMVHLGGDHRFLLAYLSFAGHPRIKLDFASPRVAERRVAWLPGRVHDRLRLAGMAPPLDLLAGAAADVFLFPSFVRAPLARTPASVTVLHDLAYLREPGHMPAAWRDELLRLVPRSLDRSTAVVAVSDWTRRDIVEAYRVDAERVHVVRPGVDHSRFRPQPPEEVARVRASHGIDRPYVLFTGTLEPRKNLQALLAAFRALPPDVRRAHALVLTGGRGWMDEGLRADMAATHRAGVRLVETGYVPADDLPALYTGCAAFAFPSRYEGFGLPVLEAMACGAPVVASDRTALPEVVGDAGLLVDPGDVDALADALARVLVDRELAADLGRRGRDRAATYDWASSGRSMLDLLVAVAAQSRGRWRQRTTPRQ